MWKQVTIPNQEVICMLPSGKEEVSSLQWSLTENISHTPGQATYPEIVY